MATLNLKLYSTVFFAIAFLCAVFMLTERTYGYRTEIQTVFFISGAAALIISLISSRQEANKEDFNILFWLGNLIVFIGLLFKTYYLPYGLYVIFLGIGITAISYFVNPFSHAKDREQDDELLDR